MIIAHTLDRSIEIVVYQTDRIFIAFNRDGVCVTRIAVSTELLTEPLTDIVLPAPTTRRS